MKKYLMNNLEFLTEEEELKQLLTNLKLLEKRLSLIFKQKFNRSIPFSDTLFNRWERASNLGFGNGVSIYDSSYVFGNVEVGENTWIGPFTILDGSGGLNIGRNCSISAGVQIYSHDSVNWAISGGKKPYELLPTKIGDNCYIGPNCIISKGVEIGDGCIIGANSFVNKSFSGGSKLAGNPAIIISN
jgi:acetyltransferase-like isoleucine patch superfamily enzyme